MGDLGRFRAIVTTVWAVGVLVHLLGNPAVSYAQALPAVAGVVPVVAAVLAGAVAMRPTHRPTSAALVVAVWVLAAVRLPVLANNLVLLGVVGLALHTARDHATVVRTVVRAGAAAYVLAAFAKYNSAFLDPAVSCAPLILDRLVASWNLPALPRAVAGAAPVVALVIESAVGIGLLVPRLRRHAALLGVVFHGLLAYDLDQHFWDFTAALLPVFAAASPALVLALAARGRRLVPSGVARVAVVVLAAGAALSGAALPAALFHSAGHLVWLSAGSLVVIGWVLVHVVQRPASLGLVSGGRWTVPAVALVALVVANGLTPYLQLKTGYSWNMYSNLRVVDGTTNHLLVPAVDLRGGHEDLLTVVAASDPAVQAYTREGARLPRVQLEDWVARTPGSSVTARDGSGDEVVLEHATVSRGVSAWVPRVAPLRPVTETCLLAYGPAG